MQIFAFTFNDLYVEAFDTHMVTVAFTTYIKGAHVVFGIIVIQVAGYPRIHLFSRTKLMLFPDRSNSGLSLEKVYE